MKVLDFENKLLSLYDKINQLKALSEEGSIDLSKEIARIEQRAELLKKNIYSRLTPQQIIQISRHQNRPDSLSLINLIFDDFVELHGDRLYGDDRALIGGLAQIQQERVVVIGHQKGHDTRSNIDRNFGMPNPEGYRKALRLMKLAEKFNLPVITFIDTPGAFPGIEAEERGQAEAIARNLKEMSALSVPIISFIIGEGGSGGALGIGVANKLYMLEYSIYSVITPEGCASILFRDAKKSDIAAELLKITAKDITELNVADDIVKEPLGGAHHNWEVTASNIKSFILSDLQKYKKIKNNKVIIEERYNKFRNLGQFSN
ncbi:MAG: acetyl-CoA carboxylase carboxyltransferase subunit alpha [bacterium]|nr:acetyl-CoA carboxylase carboxyltransferase subunit alpha [bacterium]